MVALRHGDDGGLYRRPLYDLIDSSTRLSCHDLIALLTLLGLTAELVAVLLILRSVGVGSRTGAWLRSLPARVSYWIRKVWPWAETPEPQYIDAGVANEINLSGDLTVTVE